MHNTIRSYVQDILNNPIEEIKEIDTITHQNFHNTYTNSNSPVVMTEMMANWPAKTKWDLDFFEKIGKDKQAFISKGNIRQGITDWEFGDFLSYIQEIKDYKINKSNAYLSNLSLLKLFPELANDVDFSLVSKYKKHNSTSFWIGPPGTITGWHTDRLNDNILAQVYGKKLVFLVSPDQNSKMPLSDKYEPGSKLCAVSMEDFDENNHKTFKDVKVKYALLEPHSMLFIPKNWWHCVYGIDISISSNNFGHTGIDHFRMKSSEIAKRQLHSLGLYGKNCVCHYYDDNGKRQKR
jgi:hypothetical protein